MTAANDLKPGAVNRGTLAELSPDEQRRYRLDLAAFGTAAISIDGQGKPTYRPLIEIQIERKAQNTSIAALHQ